MKKTIARVVSGIVALAGEIEKEAEAMPDDPGIAGAECVVYLRDSQRAMNQAREALRLSIANPPGDGKPPALFPE